MGQGDKSYINKRLVGHIAFANKNKRGQSYDYTSRLLPLYPILKQYSLSIEQTWFSFSKIRFVPSLELASSAGEKDF